MPYVGRAVTRRRHPQSPPPPFCASVRKSMVHYLTHSWDLGYFPATNPDALRESDGSIDANLDRADIGILRGDCGCPDRRPTLIAVSAFRSHWACTHHR